MKTRFFVQFEVVRSKSGQPTSLRPRAVTKSLPSVHYDGIVIGFDVSVPEAAFRVPIINAALGVEMVGQPTVESLPIGVVEDQPHE